MVHSTATDIFLSYFHLNLTDDTCNRCHELMIIICFEQKPPYDSVH